MWRSMTRTSVGVLVRLAEGDAGAHVEEVSHSGPVVTGAGHLRNVMSYRRLGVEAALGGEDSADAPHDGLRDRHQQVRRVGPHLTDVTFEDDLAVVQHDDGVGPGVRQHLAEVDGPAPIRSTAMWSSAGGLSGRDSSFARAPRAIRCVGTISRRCWKDHRMKGGSCQLPRLTTDSGGGGNPAIRASDIRAP